MKKIAASLTGMLSAGIMTLSMQAFGADLKPYSFACPFPETGLTTLEILRHNYDFLEELTGGEITNVQTDLTPDAVLSFVESQVAAGVDGLLVCPPSDSVLPTITQLCQEAGIYWGIAFRTISDPEIKAMVEASPYYVGNCYEDEYTAGYTCGQWMGENGYKKIALISQPKGDTTCDTREAGLMQAAEEYGLEIVGESRGHTQASETTAAVESFLAANDDLDIIFFAGTGASGIHEAAIKAIQDAGRDVKVVTIDYPDEMAEDFRSGVLAYSYAQFTLSYDLYLTSLKVINAIQGTPVTGQEGSWASNSITMTAVDSLEAAEKIQSVVGNSDYIFYDEEEIKNYFGWENPDLNEETLQELIDTYEVHE